MNRSDPARFSLSFLCGELFIIDSNNEDKHAPTLSLFSFRKCDEWSALKLMPNIVGWQAQQYIYVSYRSQDGNHPKTSKAEFLFWRFPLLTTSCGWLSYLGDGDATVAAKYRGRVTMQKKRLLITVHRKSFRGTHAKECRANKCGKFWLLPRDCRDLLTAGACFVNLKWCGLWHLYRDCRGFRFLLRHAVKIPY